MAMKLTVVGRFALILVGCVPTIPTLAQQPVAAVTSEIKPVEVVEVVEKVVELGANGKLIYFPYSVQGDTIPDFSHCGYGGGGVALPRVAVKVAISPQFGSGDDLPRLQKAVDDLAH